MVTALIQQSHLHCAFIFKEKSLGQLYTYTQYIPTYNIVYSKILITKKLIKRKKKQLNKKQVL